MKILTQRADRECIKWWWLLWHLLCCQVINATPITTHYHHCDDTHYDTLLWRHPLHTTREIDLAPRARLSVSTGSHTDTSSQPPCLSRLSAEPLGWKSPSATGVSDPRPILGVYEVSVEPIIRCPQGPQVHLLGVYEVSGQPIIGCVPRDPKDFAKLLKWNSSISFPRQESDCQIVNGSHWKGPTQSYNVGRGHKAVCANFQQKVVFYRGGVSWKAMQFHFDRGGS